MGLKVQLYAYESPPLFQTELTTALFPGEGAQIETNPAHTLAAPDSHW